MNTNTPEMQAIIAKIEREEARIVRCRDFRGHEHDLPGALPAVTIYADEHTQCDEIAHATWLSDRRVRLRFKSTLVKSAKRGWHQITRWNWDRLGSHYFGSHAYVLHEGVWRLLSVLGEPSPTQRARLTVIQGGKSLQRGGA